MYRKGKELKRLARKNLSGKYGMTILAFLLVNIIALLVQMVFTSFMSPNGNLTQVVIYYLANYLITLLLAVLESGLMFLHLNLARGKEAKISDIFYAFSHHPDRFILAAFFVSLLTILCMIPFAAGVAFLVANFNFAGIMALFIGSILSLILVIYLRLASFLYNFILLDQPDFSAWACIKESFALMQGQKGRLIYIVLSFLGMLLLAILSLGIGLLWVNSYMQQTYANFYLDIKGQLNQDETRTEF